MQQMNILMKKHFFFDKLFCEIAFSEYSHSSCLDINKKNYSLTQDGYR